MINASGQEIELEIGETFWIVDGPQGEMDKMCFSLNKPTRTTNHWRVSKLCVHLDWDEDIKEYAEEHCWGNLNADEQRTMAECPVVERFAETGLSTDGRMMCPICNFD